jgi:hypothetical protein
MHRYDKENHAIDKQNTTISAIISLKYLAIGQERCLAMLEKRKHDMGREMTLEESITATKAWGDTQPEAWQKQLHAVVCENPNARKPWPRTLFNGEWDERYAAADRVIRRLSAGRALREWERLTNQQPDFPDV